MNGRLREIAGSAAAALTALGLLVFAAMTVAVAGPRVTEELRTNAVRQLVAHAPADSRIIAGTIDLGSLSSALGIASPAHAAATALSYLRRNMLALPLARAATDWAGLTTPAATVSDPAVVAPQVGGAKLEFIYRSDLPAYARFSKGAPPGPARSKGGAKTIQVAVTAATAQQLGLAVGSILPIPGSGLHLRVSGIIQPQAPGAPFWTLDPIAAAPQLVKSSSAPTYWQGAAFVSGSEFSILANVFSVSSVQVTFVLPLALSNLTAAQATALPGLFTTTIGRASLISSSGGTASVTLSSGVTQLIAVFVAAEAATGSVLGLLSVSLAVVAAVVVLLAAWLLAERRRTEFAVLRARGASTGQLALRALAATATASVPGAILGTVLAVALTPGQAARQSWWLGGGIVAVALAGPAVIVAWSQRGHSGAGTSPERPDRPVTRKTASRRLVAEIGLSLAAIGGLIVLRDQGTGAGGTDFYASAAPVLVAIPVAIIMLRCYPLAVRLLLRLTGSRSGVTSYVGLARAARVQAGAVLPAFAMVLALTLVSFAGMVRAAVGRGEVTASWQQAGADAVVSGPDAIGQRQLRAIAAVPGVQRAGLLSVTSGSTAIAAVFGVVLVKPAQYAALLDGTPLGPDAASFAADDRGAGTGAGAPIAALASPSLAARLGSTVISLNVGAGHLTNFRITGTAASMSAITVIGEAGSPGYVVLPDSVLGRDVPPPSVLLIIGPAAGRAALGRAVSKLLPGDSVVFRSDLLSALQQAPLQRDAELILALGAAASALFALLVLLLTLLLAAPSRQLTLARMATMGLSAGQGRRLVLTESLPQVIAALIGGLAAALALAPLVGPALSLSVFTGSSATVPVQIDAVWLAGSAVVLLVLAIATLAVQTMAASRSAPRSLRIGE